MRFSTLCSALCNTIADDGHADDVRHAAVHRLPVATSIDSEDRHGKAIDDALAERPIGDIHVSSQEPASRRMCPANAVAPSIASSADAQGSPAKSARTLRR